MGGTLASRRGRALLAWYCLLIFGWGVWTAGGVVAGSGALLGFEGAGVPSVCGTGLVVPWCWLGWCGGRVVV